MPPAVAFPVPELDAEERFGRRDARRMDRDGQLAAVAATLALEHAGDLGLPAERVGVAVGNAHGGMATMDAAYRALHERGPDRVSPFSVPLALPNAPAAGVARVLGLHGPSSAVCTACAAGSDAIGLALLAIRDGRADAMLAGGAEAPLSAFTLAGYGQLGALAKGDGGAGRSARGPSTAAATASSWARAPASWCWRSASTPCSAAPRCWPSSPATARPATPAT